MGTFKIINVIIIYAFLKLKYLNDNLQLHFKQHQIVYLISIYLVKSFKN